MPACQTWHFGRPEQGGLGTPKARAIITSETISLLNQCMCLNDDLRQVTIQDMSQAIAHLGCSTIAEAQAEARCRDGDWGAGHEGYPPPDCSGQGEGQSFLASNWASAAPSFQTCFACVQMYILYACVYICVCAYVCRHDICIYMYLYIYLFIYMCMCMCMHICA